MMHRVWNPFLLEIRSNCWYPIVHANSSCLNHDIRYPATYVDFEWSVQPPNCLPYFYYLLNASDSQNAVNRLKLLCSMIKSKNGTPVWTFRVYIYLSDLITYSNHLFSLTNISVFQPPCITYIYLLLQFPWHTIYKYICFVVFVSVGFDLIWFFVCCITLKEIRIFYKIQIYLH